MHSIIHNYYILLNRSGITVRYVAWLLNTVGPC